MLETFGKKKREVLAENLSLFLSELVAVYNE
ncbi:hypothetical protein [Proteus terrae]